MTTTKPLTEAAARKVLRDRFSGELKIGPHAEGGEACAMEYLSVLCNKQWTDSPFGSLMDAYCRCLNDSPRWPSDRARLVGGPRVAGMARAARAVGNDGARCSTRPVHPRRPTGGTD